MEANKSGILAATALAALTGTPPQGLQAFKQRLFTSARASRRTPTMVCSAPAEIAAWNAAVDKKKQARHTRRMRRDVLAMQGKLAPYGEPDLTYEAGVHGGVEGQGA